MRLNKLLNDQRLRTWAREIVVIVIGVLIALWIGNVAQDLDWAKKRREARASLERELAVVDYASAERIHLARCVGRRLDQIDAILQGAARSGRLPPVSGVRGPPIRPWPSTTWDTVVASQTASHFELQELDSLAKAYQKVAGLRPWLDDERNAWTTFTLIDGPGGPIDAETRLALRQALARARLHAGLLPAAAGQIRHDISAAGIRTPTGPETFQGRAWEVCTPIAIG